MAKMGGEAHQRRARLMGIVGGAATPPCHVIGFCPCRAGDGSSPPRRPGMAKVVFGLSEFLARPSGCGVWANVGPGVSRGSTPGFFLATRWVGWEGGSNKKRMMKCCKIFSKY